MNSQHTKQTWRLRGLPDAAEAVRRAPSLRAAARQLGVAPSTLSRAVKDGRLPAPGRARARQDTAETPTIYATFAAWARGTYQLTRAEDELIDLAQQALDLSRDPAASATVRLQAAGRYQSILKDLQLPQEDVGHGDATAPIRFPRQAG